MLSAKDKRLMSLHEVERSFLAPSTENVIAATLREALLSAADAPSTAPIR
jgi:hypothetical protein